MPTFRSSAIVGDCPVSASESTTSLALKSDLRSTALTNEDVFCLEW